MSYSDEVLSYSEARFSSSNNLTPISLNLKLISNEESERIGDSPFVLFNYKIIKTLAQTTYRTQADDKSIYKQLSHFNIFLLIQDHHMLSVEDVIKLCHYVKYESVKAGSIIYKKGDQNNKKTYLIISGSVSHSNRDLSFLRDKLTTQISTESNDEEDSIETIETKFYSPRHKTRLPTHFSPEMRLKKSKKMADEPGEKPEPANTEMRLPSIVPEDETENRRQMHNFRKYNVGQFFGEASIFKNEDRNETMLAITDCEFVIIDEESILRAKDQITESYEDINNLFWSLIPGILTKPRDSRSYKYYDVVSFDKGAIVTNQNELGEYVYLLKEGECQAYIKRTRKQVPNPDGTTSDLSKCFRIKSNSDPNVKLFISAPGSFIGEEILFNNEGIYTYTNKVLTVNATFFRIEKSKLLNKFTKNVLNDLKKIYEQKLFSHGKVINQKFKPLYDEYSQSFLLKFATDKESGSFSARSDANSKLLPNFKLVKSTDNSPQYSDTSPSLSSRSSDDEAAKDFVKKRGDLKKKSEFLKYAKKVAEESKDLTEEAVGGSFSPSKRNRDVNNIADFKLKFETPIEDKNPKKMTSPRAKLAKLTSGAQEISPRTLNDLLDQEYKPFSRRKIPSIQNLTSSIVLHERPVTKKLTVGPRNNNQYDCVSITSLGKIPEPKTMTNLDVPSSSNFDTFTTALKSPRSIKNLKQRLELKPTVIKTLGRIQNKT